MRFEFRCYGHSNILALHRNTVEFTRDGELSRRGDCVLGVKADFHYEKLRKFLHGIKSGRVRATIYVGDISDDFSFYANPDFSDRNEIVIRKGDYRSSRTLGVGSDKAAFEIKRELVHKMKNADMELKVFFEDEKEAT